MLVNGQLQHHLPVLDRAVQYGDGAFETVLIRNATPVFWQAHLARLSLACDRLKILLDNTLLEQEVPRLLADSSLFSNDSDPFGVLKIIVSRGAGGRGYGVAPGMSATRIVQFHPLPNAYERYGQEGVCVFKCAHPLSSNRALAGIKHLNRLDQVLASMELPPYAQEGLMCDDAGKLIEGIKSNVFLYRKGQWLTPSLTSAGVAGVMRAQIIAYCEKNDPSNLIVQEIDLETLQSASEVFVCNSVFGIWPVTSVHWEGSMLEFAIGQNTRLLQRNVWDSA